MNGILFEWVIENIVKKRFGCNDGIGEITFKLLIIPRWCFLTFRIPERYSKENSTRFSGWLYNQRGAGD
jgi:hypothetical protein